VLILEAREQISRDLLSILEDSDDDIYNANISPEDLENQEIRDRFILE
jgi:hypothetical protein